MYQAQPTSRVFFKLQVLCNKQSSMCTSQYFGVATIRLKKNTVLSFGKSTAGCRVML